MRLHHLTMTAFGPFDGTVEVDFDALSASGLFLLTGATGAGKTSVLDAVCFALYGEVPGDRAGAKHLRSDHAPAGRAPQVVLEVSVGERRFRFTRSPAWYRPKVRGSGETKVQAHVIVEERREEGWTGLTNRIDDAGLLVGDLLGMTCTQFTQVAMLPQGRFQAFLRASSTERHAVLQKLFRTDRFERVEKWLVERRTEARRAGEAGALEVRAVLHRIEEVGGTPLPDELDEDLARAAESGDVAAWASGIRDAAIERRDLAQDALLSAVDQDTQAATALAEGRSRHALVERAARAQDDLELLDRQQPEDDLLRQRLTRHHRAAPVAALAERSRTSRSAAALAATRWETQRERVRGIVAAPVVDIDRASLVRAHQAAHEAQAQARAFLPRERELVESLDRSGRITAERDAAGAELASLQACLAALPAQVADAEARREIAASAAAGVSGAEAGVRRLETLTAAASRLTRVEADLVDARSDLLAATTATQIAREVHLDVREARINGMAAELAGSLASGCSCPVCGSAQHPSPARAVAGSAGRVEEDLARRAYEDAGFAEQNQQVRVAALESELTTLSAQVGAEDRAELPALLAAARSELEALLAESARLEAATEALAVVRESQAATARRVQELTTLHAALEAEQSALAGVLESLRAARADLLGDEAGSVEDLLALRTEAVTCIAAALAARDAWEAAHAAAAGDDDALLDAARSAGFAGVEAALEALLDSDEADLIATALTVNDARRLAAEQTLGDPEVHAALQHEAPDLPGLVVAQEAAARALRDQGTLADTTRSRARRLIELGEHLDAALSAWAPLRDRQRLTADLASLVEGRSVDNPLKMRLAAYVLAERLRQVVEAANERLARMTEQRYALEHSEDRGVGELRGGLSLRIRDDWTGGHRDPATLSGGETFLVSLALALGLADTVANEAGGTDIDTLFIDEGFGSLDPDALEQVMDTLDSLRDGGRVVGLVSHVPELRSRITTQLEVSKGRTGSTLRPVLVNG